MMKKHFTKKKLIIIGIIFTVVVIFVARSWPLPSLGPRLHYFDKYTYGGCLLTLCVAERHNYFFTVDMSEEELQTYFPSGHFDPESRSVMNWDEDSPDYVGLGYDSPRGGFGIRYYSSQNATSVAQYYKLRNPEGRALVMISDRNYEVVKRLFD